MARAAVPARGMRDVLPAEKEKRERVLGSIRSTYRRFGFTEIETPAVEPIERLRSNQGGENESMLFQIMKRGLDSGTPVNPAEAVDLALRYDLTVPLTRFYASHAAELPTVFRALQTGPVWRAERPQKGRYRQFTQVDIDIIGEPGTIAEMDLIVATLAAFEDLGLAEGITLRINDRRILLDLLAAVGIAPERSAETLIALDKLDKIGAAGVAAEIEGRGLASGETVERLLASVTALQARTGLDDAPLRDGTFTVDGTDVQVSLYDLPEIVATVAKLAPWADVAFDVSLVRGMGYYTGPIFEMTHPSSAGSVAGGGRYDSVVGKWLGRDVPACGFSIGFERIIDLVPDAPSTSRRVAVLYAEGTPAADVLTARQQHQADGSDVALVRAPRKLSGRFLDGLTAEGFTHVDSGAVSGDGPGTVRELRRG
ncbi:HisS family protein [Cellulomonas cellasea]|uniref:Histidyl-tRNA synthetase n=1 Tax=Cellulomonas cellasea TaxID=43670 RepID=A0A7W4UJS9_9CELL|nr:ATP phosphoribosyltransferase regulatory subunit [Cellulomonas cellasea]MBB2925440.1 histidyl-tRNA synthetase [Cellulomonas cellasea]